MRDRVLAIVTLIAQYVMEEREFLNESDIVEELLGEGFAADEIDAAFSWMEQISIEQRERQRHEGLHQPTFRIFTFEEEQLLSREARGFLIRLRTLGIIDDDIQEEILDRAGRLHDEQLSLEDIKSLTALTLFAHSQQDWQREVDCFMSDDWTRLIN
ncbi:MAG: DUF494 family protein [Deltaproteobacteria bacterium]|nr:MAG: DUF494 family protein [Deltaproteobacteria bacterium]